MRSMLREGGNLTPTARTLWEIQERSCSLPVETATNVYMDVQSRRQQAEKRGQQRREAVKDADTLRAYQQETKRLFLECLGGVDELESGFRVTDLLDCGGYVIEKLLLQPRKGTWATANVYVPKTEGTKPAVLVTVGHDDRGKADPEYQYLAQKLCHQGMIVLVLDPLGQGERFEHYEPELSFQPIQGCSGEHDLLNWKGNLLGLPVARYFVQDGLAALNYLCARPDVDAGRIGLTGHSGGGTQTIMLMGAAGDRFAAAAPCAYVTDNQAMMDTGIDPDDEMLWPGSMAAGLDYVDLLAGAAPKPVRFLTDRQDFFPREGTLRTLEKARALWASAGSETLPDMDTAESGHSYTNALADSAAAFFGRHLQANERQEDFQFVSRSPEALWCTPQGQVKLFDPALRTIHDEMKDALAALAPAADKAKAWLENILHLDELKEWIEPRVFNEGICGHVQYRHLLWRPQEGYWNSGVLLRDFRQEDKALPTVIALWPEGTARLCEHSTWIHRTLQRGHQVLVVNLAASGALMPSRLGNTSMYVGWSTMYNLNAYLMQLGDSLFALRTRQTAAAVRLMSGWQETSEEISLYAQGEFSRYADIAAWLTETPVYSDENYQTWSEIVRDDFHDQTNTHEWVLPGALRYFDAPDVRRALAELGLLAQNPSK